MKHKQDKNIIIPYIFPTDYHMAPFQEAYSYDPYVNYIGVIRDTIEKTMQNDEAY